MGKIEVFENRPAVLGINSLGRIGKLTLWHHIGRKYFQEIVVNRDARWAPACTRLHN